MNNDHAINANVTSTMRAITFAAIIAASCIVAIITTTGMLMDVYYDGA